MEGRDGAAWTAGAALALPVRSMPLAAALTTSSCTERVSRRVYPFFSFSFAFFWRVARAALRLMPRLLPFSLPGSPVGPQRHSKLALPPPRSSTQPVQNLFDPLTVQPVLSPSRSVKLRLTFSTMVLMPCSSPFGCGAFVPVSHHLPCPPPD